MWSKQIFIEKAKTAKKESKIIEFKESFNVDFLGDWCEILKDIFAIANSGGGVIIFGVTDNGMPSVFDCNKILLLDSAFVTDKASRYSDSLFEDFEIVEIIRDNKKVAALVIEPAKEVMMFKNAGTYRTKGGKEAIAFNQGTIYFRHGTKSEPGTANDLRNFNERKRQESDNKSISQQIESLKNNGCPSLKVTEWRHHMEKYFTTIENVGDDLYGLTFEMTSDNGIYTLQTMNRPNNLSRGSAFGFNYCRVQNLHQFDTLTFSFKDKSGKKYSQRLNLMDRTTSVINFEPVEIVPLTILEEVEQISKDACKILRACSIDGQLIKVYHLGKFIGLRAKNYVFYNGKLNPNPRQAANWEHAIEELLERDLLVEDKKQEGVFNLTKKGFEWADWLVENKVITLL